MLKIIGISVIILGIAIFGLCLNIIFKKNGKFPDGEIGHNKALRRQGIICMKEEEEKLWGRSTYIRVTKNKGVKFERDNNCLNCTHDCELRDKIG